jgi:hypothetical protein
LLQMHDRLPSVHRYVYCILRNVYFRLTDSDHLKLICDFFWFCGARTLNTNLQYPNVLSYNICHILVTMKVVSFENELFLFYNCLVKAL